jgi:hypothetical protein
LGGFAAAQVAGGGSQYEPPWKMIVKILIDKQ